MGLVDMLPLALESVRSQRLRSFLTGLGVAIGISAVVLLTSIGEGLRQFVQQQFTQFGTNILGIYPGKTETWGMGFMIGAARKITLQDVEAVRRVPGVVDVVPLTFGNARIEHGERGRDVIVDGVTSEGPRVWNWPVRIGSFIPEGDPEHLPAVVVLGPKVARELFGHENPLGEFVRVGGARYRVIGIMEPKGNFLGFDLDDMGFIPLGRAQRRAFTSSARNRSRGARSPSARRIQPRRAEVTAPRREGAWSARR